MILVNICRVKYYQSHHAARPDFWYIFVVNICLSLLSDSTKKSSRGWKKVHMDDDDLKDDKVMGYG